MKVLFLDQSGQLGGAELSLLDLIPHLRCQSHVVLFEHGRFEDALTQKHIRVDVVDLSIVVRREAGILAYLLAAPEVCRAVAQVAVYAEGVNLIYANSPKAWIIGALAASWKKIPLVLHLRDILSAGHFSVLNRRAMVFAANKAATKVIANSEATRTAFVQAGGREELATVIPNGFDPALFVKSAKSYRKIHEEFAIHEAPLVVMPGRLAPSEAQAMGEAARERVVEHFTLTDTAAKTRELLRQVVEPGNLSPKILFLDQSGQLGGAELCLADVVQPYRKSSLVILLQEGPFVAFLKRIGVQVRVEASSRKTMAVRKESGMAAMVWSIPSMVRLACRIARLAAKYDLIYANTAKALLAGSAAASWTGKPMVFHLHDIISREHFSGLNRRLIVSASWIARCWVIANSEATKEAFIQAGGNAKRVTVIYNGFRIPETTPRPADSHIGPPLLLMVGRMTEWKGQHVLLEAAARLPTVRVRYVGEALFTEADLHYSRRLRNRAQEPDLRDRIEFAGFCEDLCPEYERASVVVHASIAPEPFGRVIVEAQLAGRPVVATNLGGAREIIRNAETGWLVPPGDVETLAATLKQILSDPAWAQAVATAGQVEARGRFCLDTMCGKTEEVINNAMRG